MPGPPAHHPGTPCAPNAAQQEPRDHREARLESSHGPAAPLHFSPAALSAVTFPTAIDRKHFIAFPGGSILGVALISVSMVTSSGLRQDLAFLGWCWVVETGEGGGCILCCCQFCLFFFFFFFFNLCTIFGARRKWQSSERDAFSRLAALGGAPGPLSSPERTAASGTQRGLRLSPRLCPLPPLRASPAAVQTAARPLSADGAQRILLLGAAASSFPFLSSSHRPPRRRRRVTAMPPAHRTRLRRDTGALHNGMQLATSMHANGFCRVVCT